MSREKHIYIEEQRRQERQYQPWAYGGMPPPMLHGNEKRLATAFWGQGIVCLFCMAEGVIRDGEWMLVPFLGGPGLLSCWIGFRYLQKARRAKKHRRT